MEIEIASLKYIFKHGIPRNVNCDMLTDQEFRILQAIGWKRSLPTNRRYFIVQEEKTWSNPTKGTHSRWAQDF
jgi:hypothetical protein